MSKTKGSRLTAHLRRLGLFVFGFAVLVGLTGGIALVLGKSHTYSGFLSRFIGVLVVMMFSVLLFATARKWAKWFVAMCFLAGLKALFALLFGFTLSQPRLLTNRPLVSAIFLLIAAIVLLSYRFLTTPPSNRVDRLALTGAVIGILSGIITEPNLWPLLATVVLLGISWLVDRRLTVQTLKSRAGHA